SRLTYELARGRLFQLRLGLPPGWDVEHVQVGDTNEFLKSWVPLEDKTRSLLVIDLQRPLLPQNPLVVTVRLRWAWGRNLPPQGLDFPDIEPLEARFRSGALAITVDPRYRARASRPSSSVAGADDADRGKLPWGARTPD